MVDREVGITENQRTSGREIACSALAGACGETRLGPRPWRIDASAMALGLMWLFIAAVSTIDVYFSIKYQYRLADDELNPIGRWLMQLDGGSVGLFLACKFFGNLVALGTLQVLSSSYRTICLAATAALTALQGLLAIVLLT